MNEQQVDAAAQEFHIPSESVAKSPEQTKIEGYFKWAFASMAAHAEARRAMKAGRIAAEMRARSPEGQTLARMSAMTALQGRLRKAGVSSTPVGYPGGRVGIVIRYGGVEHECATTAHIDATLTMIATSGGSK